MKVFYEIIKMLGLGDISIYRDIFIRDYRIEGTNLSDDISKLSSCSLTIVILLACVHSRYKNPKKFLQFLENIVFKRIKTIS